MTMWKISLCLRVTEDRTREHFYLENSKLSFEQVWMMRVSNVPFDSWLHHWPKILLYHSPRGLSYLKMMLSISHIVIDTVGRKTWINGVINSAGNAREVSLWWCSSWCQWISVAVRIFGCRNWPKFIVNRQQSWTGGWSIEKWWTDWSRYNAGLRVNVVWSTLLYRLLMLRVFWLLVSARRIY